MSGKSLVSQQWAQGWQRHDATWKLIGDGFLRQGQFFNAGLNRHWNALKPVMTPVEAGWRRNFKAWGQQHLAQNDEFIRRLSRVTVSVPAYWTLGNIALPAAVPLLPKALAENIHLTTGVPQFLAPLNNVAKGVLETVGLHASAGRDFLVEGAIRLPSAYLTLYPAIGSMYAASPKPVQNFVMRSLRQAWQLPNKLTQAVRKLIP